MTAATKYELLDAEGAVLFAGPTEPAGDDGALHMSVPPEAAASLHSVRLLGADGTVLDEMRLRSTAEEMVALLRSKFDSA